MEPERTIIKFEIEQTPQEKALSVAFQCGQIDGSHHKEWVIDQMVRALTGDDYQEFIDRYTIDKETGDEYEWSEGIAP